MLQGAGKEDARTAGPRAVEDRERAPAEAAPLGGPLELAKHDLVALRGLAVEILAEDRDVWEAEMRDAERIRRYLKGDQFIMWDEADKRHKSLDAVLAEGDDEEGDDVPLPLNIIEANCWSIVAVLSGGQPVTRWIAEDVSAAEDVQGAKAGDLVVERFRHAIDTKKVLAKAAYYAYLDGRCAGLVYYAESERLFGTRTLTQQTERQGVVEPERLKCPICAALVERADAPAKCGCGHVFDRGDVLPAVIGTITEATEVRVPASGALARLIPVTNYRVDPYADEISDTAYFAWADDVHWSRLAWLYPQFREELRSAQSGSTDDGIGQQTRDRIKSTVELEQSGSQKKLLTFERVWLRPETYERLTSHEELRERLKVLAPRGVMVAYAGEIVLGAVHSDLDETVRLFVALPGDGQHTPALHGNAQDIQDMVNVLGNAALSVAEESVQPTFIDAELFGDKAGDVRHLRGASYYAVARRATESIQAQVFRPPPPVFSPQADAFRQELAGPVLQTATAAHPSMTGAGDPNQETFRGLRMLRDMNMGRQGLPWRGLVRFMRELDELAVAVTIRHADVGTVFFTRQAELGGYETARIDLEALKRGRFRIRSEGDENYPISQIDRRDLYTYAISNPALGFFHPANFAELKTTLGWGRIDLPGEAQWRATLELVPLLLKEQPVPAVDDICDDHATALEALKWWLAKFGRETESERPVGVMAVRARARAHFEAGVRMGQIQGPAAPAAPAMPGGAGGADVAGPPLPPPGGEPAGPADAPPPMAEGGAAPMPSLLNGGPA